MMSGIEHLGEGDEVEEDGGDGSGDGDVAPPRTIIEGGRQHGERGYTVEEDRDSEPEEGHSNGSPARNSRIFSISGMKSGWDSAAISVDLGEKYR
jgi:hypothetical protein